MRCSSLSAPLYYCALATLLLLWCAWWLGSAGRRALAARGARVRHLSAIAANLSRLIAATETESAVLNRDISRLVRMIHGEHGGNSTGPPHR